MEQQAAEFISAVLTSGFNPTQLQQAPAVGTQAASSIAAIRRIVLDHGEAAVVADLQQQVQATTPVACKALKTVLLALRSSAFSHTATEADSSACSQLRSTLFSQLPSWVHGIPGDEQQFAVEVVTAVMPDIDQLSPDDLAALMTAVLTSMEQKQPHACILLELLPACLAALQAAPGPASSTQAAAGGVDDDDGDAGAGPSQSGAAGVGGAVEAAKHRDAAIHRLSHCQWQPEQVCQILTVLKGMALTPDQLKSLLGKAIRACRNAGLQQLPPILYQVLLLSGSGPGMRCYALRLIISLFDILETQQGHNTTGAAGAAGGGAEGEQQQQPEDPQQQQHKQGAAATLPSAVLMQVQATLLMHVSTMLRYDAALGSEWIKWASGEAGTSTSTSISNAHTHYFLLQVLFTMSRQPKHEQTVLQLLKKRIMQACEEDAAGTGAAADVASCGGCSGWMSGVQQVNRCPTIKEMQEALLKAIRCSPYASELVAPGVLQLADVLISTRCTQPLYVVLAMKQQCGACSLPPQVPAAARAVVLGLQLLQEVFAVHAEARGEVLKVLQGKLASNDLSAALPIVLLLESISQHQPALLSNYLPQLKECMGSFAGLSSDTAMALLLAVWPLCRVRSDLQDFVTMLLRKMMYRQDVDGRLIATRGFLRLICQHLQDSPLPPQFPAFDPSAASCSQASLSQHASLSSSKDVNLLQELTGVLRRALSQQAPVREALYDGILQILSADPASCELLAELLLPHLRTYYVEDEHRLPPLLLHKCAQLQHGEAVLLEPLPALLSCVYRLTSTAQPVTQQQRRQPPGPGSLEGSEGWPGGVGNNNNEDDQELSTTAALKACFNSVRVRLGQCHLDHFELPAAADMSPLLPEGLLGQLHAANLLGSLQVVIEATVAEVTAINAQQPDPDARDGDAVNKLGSELLQLFSLYSEVYQLAVDGSKGGGKKGRKAGGNNAAVAEGSEAETSTAVGHKRSRPSDGFTPVHKQRPRFSPACLAQLCAAVVDDGLMQLPSSYDVTKPDHHAQLAREAGFRACVLRSCSALLEDAQAAAASAMLLQDGAQEGSGAGAGSASGSASAPAAAEVLELGPALFKVAKLVMQTATAGGRPSTKPSSSGGGTSSDTRRGAGGAAAAAAASGDGCETLEHLSATALLQLLRLADATQQLAPLFAQLPLDNGSMPAQAAAAQGGDSGSDASGAAIAAAVLPRLPQLLACADSLLQQGCFKESQVMVECLGLLGRRLGAPVVTPPPPPTTAAAAENAEAQQQGQGQQQGQQGQAKAGEPAFAALSRWAHEALQQEQPEVKAVPLVRSLVDLFIRYHGKDCVVAIKTTMKAVQEVVGDTDGATQATQDHGTILPMLIAGKTAQPATLTPLSIINEGLDQLEKLLAANLKGGVFQDGDSAQVAKLRRRLAAALCKRLHDLLMCLRVLVGTIIAMPQVIDQQTRIATRAYKLLATLARAYQIPKKPSASSTTSAAAAAANNNNQQPAGGAAADAAAAASRCLSVEFEALVGYVHKELTPSLNHALKDLGLDEAAASLARVKKDAKLMPALVYAMEEWERKLVSTGKSANKNLLRDAKRAFCRDFKVKVAGGGAAPGAAAAGGGVGQQAARGGGAAGGAGRAAAAAKSSRSQGAAGSRDSGAASSRGRGGTSQAGGGDEEMGEAAEGEEEAEEADGDAEDDAAENQQQQQRQAPQAKVPRAVGGLKGRGRAPLHRRQG